MVIILLGITKKEFKMRESHQDRITLRKKLWLSQNKICVYCETVIPYSKASLDHVIPVTLLEDNLGEDNLVVCCKKCNYNKGKQIVFTNLYDGVVYPIVDIPVIFQIKYILKKIKNKR